MSPRYTLILAIAVGSLVVSASASKRDAEATTLVEHAKQLSEIRSEGAPAFRLKASLRVFNQNGSTTEGEYIENWASIAQWRKEVAVGDFRRTEVAMGRKRWLLDSNPSAPEQIGTLSSFTELGGLQPATWPSRKLEDRESNGLSVRCVESGVRALCFDKIVGTLISESTLVRTGEAYRKSICATLTTRNSANACLPNPTSAARTRNLRSRRESLSSRFNPHSRRHFLLHLRVPGNQ
jgi:hypothetical protein